MRFSITITITLKNLINTITITITITPALVGIQFYVECYVHIEFNLQGHLMSQDNDSACTDIACPCNSIKQTIRYIRIK